jgi:transposase
MIAEEEMIKVEKREQIRRAYFVEHKSIRQIARELHCGRHTVRDAIEDADARTYTLSRPRSAPVLGPYKEQINALLAENEHLPPKQRYTSETIYKQIEQDGYQGAKSTLRRYMARQRKAKKRPQVYLPLAFDPGIDAQVDWGEAVVFLSGKQRTVQVFVMRLCYSRRQFSMAFPNQKQEAFLEGHVEAFRFLGGIPHRISYDNLKAAVLRVLKGRNRIEQDRFVVFRSHYLFESRFCTPGQGHEKGGVESGVGFGRRNFMVPIPKVASFEELNEHLLTQCQADDSRTVKRQSLSIGEMWREEEPHLRPLPAHDFECCRVRSVTLNGYGQVTFETNRYSVPAKLAQKHLVLKAFPFRIDILNQEQVIASHARCYGREQDILDPLHYLPLVEQRPGAFEHAKPIRQWRKQWPPAYEQLLAQLRQQRTDEQGVREFIRVLRLHEHYPAALIEEAVTQALVYGCGHADGVMLCLNQLTTPETWSLPLDLVSSEYLSTHPELTEVGSQPPDLDRYNALLGVA